MDHTSLTSLPQYSHSHPDAPSASSLDKTTDQDELAPSFRRWTILLQFTFLLLFWGGIYVLRQQALAIWHQRVAERKAEEERPLKERVRLLTGLWKSSQGDGKFLDIRAGELNFVAKRQVIGRGGYTILADNLEVWLYDSSDKIMCVMRDSDARQLFHYRVTAEELTLQGGGWLMSEIRFRLGILEPPLDGILRFKRVGE